MVFAGLFVMFAAYATPSPIIDPRRAVEVSSEAALHVATSEPAELSIPLEALPGATEPLSLDLSELFS
jgi:hypothetical protein